MRTRFTWILGVAALILVACAGGVQHEVLVLQQWAGRSLHAGQCGYGYLQP
jgi:outer membrane biogenesis lipoprotein LolB